MQWRSISATFREILDNIQNAAEQLARSAKVAKGQVARDEIKESLSQLMWIRNSHKVLGDFLDLLPEDDVEL